MTATPDCALGRADQALARQGRSFHWARMFLSSRHAARATRLYGFCRGLDDLADDAGAVSDPGDALDRIRAALSIGSSADGDIADGIELFRECSISLEIPNALLDGLISDLGVVRMQDSGELLRYAYRVAGTVGLMMCGALDVDHPAARPHAIDLGIAMQLTNICRDVTEDAQARRRYLPANLIGGAEPVQLISPDEVLQARIRDTIRDLLDLADQFYASGEAGLSYLPLRARLGILVAARVYRAIGTRLRGENFSTWTGRVFVSDASKVLITVGVFLTLPLNRTFRRPLPHQATLHAALDGLPGAHAQP